MPYIYDRDRETLINITSHTHAGILPRDLSLGGTNTLTHRTIYAHTHTQQGSAILKRSLQSMKRAFINCPMGAPYAATTVYYVRKPPSTLYTKPARRRHEKRCNNVPLERCRRHDTISTAQHPARPPARSRRLAIAEIEPALCQLRTCHAL